MFQIPFELLKLIVQILLSCTETLLSLKTDELELTTSSSLTFNQINILNCELLSDDFYTI